MRQRRQILVLALILVLTLGAVVPGAEKSRPGRSQKKDAEPAFAEVQDDPALPRVLLIGDSISIGYTLPVRKALAGKANVHRPAANCGPTIRGLADLDKWLGKGKWDVIHFNWGLHDLRKDDGLSHQVPIDQYEKNLNELVRRLKKTDARLIWCSTTPVPEGAKNRTKGDEVKYNAAARKIMEANGVAVNDLYGFALPQLGKIQRRGDVHFSQEGSRTLAGQVAAAILKALERPAK